MSLDVDLMVTKPVSVWEYNITHNLGKMADAVVLDNGHTLYEVLWRPDEHGWKTADDIAAKIFPGEKVSEALRRTVQGFLNVIEDARIDKRQKRRYPGCRRNYLVGYRELVDRDFFGTTGRDINSMNFIDRLNMYFKGGNIHSNLIFTPEEKVMLNKVDKAETWAEVVSLTEEIYLYCKKKLEEMNEMDLTLTAGDDEGDEDADGDWIDGDDEGTDGETEDGEGKSKAVNQGEGDIASRGYAASETYPESLVCQ